MAAGVPVIASDLPALREIGADVPDFLSPQGSDVWQTAIDDYASPNAPRRAAQIDRIATWQRPTWAAHFAIVDNAMETILVQTDARR